MPAPAVVVEWKIYRGEANLPSSSIGLLAAVVVIEFEFGARIAERAAPELTGAGGSSAVPNGFAG